MSPTKEAALEAICANARERRGFSVFTLNLDHLVKLRSDEEFATPIV